MLPSLCERRSAPRRARVMGIVAALVALGACGSDGDSEPSPADTADAEPTVVVTYSVLGDVVSQLVGDQAQVEVIIPNGQDPHDYAASARDIERMMNSALVVSNGLDLEEGIVDALGQVAADGVAVFEVSEHITVRELADDEAGHEDEADHDHDHEGGDPHLWTDPLVMAEMLPDLAAALETALGVDLTAELAAVQVEMTDLDAQVREIMSVIPAGQCKLVTGHESLGYFADRYGCELIGAVIPSLSSNAESSARDLAELLEVATAEQVNAIFTEVGTPGQVAEQVAEEIGVPLVELPSHNLPDVGGYQAFVVELATEIATALTTPA